MMSMNDNIPRGRVGRENKEYKKYKINNKEETYFCCFDRSPQRGEICLSTFWWLPVHFTRFSMFRTVLWRECLAASQEWRKPVEFCTVVRVARVRTLARSECSPLAHLLTAVLASTVVSTTLASSREEEYSTIFCPHNHQIKSNHTHVAQTSAFSSITNHRPDEFYGFLCFFYLHRHWARAVRSFVRSSWSFLLPNRHIIHSFVNLPHFHNIVVLPLKKSIVVWLPLHHFHYPELDKIYATKWNIH